MWAIIDLLFKGITNETFINHGVTFVDLILFCSLPYFGTLIMLNKNFIHRNLFFSPLAYCWDFLNSSGIILSYDKFCDNANKLREFV